MDSSGGAADNGSAGAVLPIEPKMGVWAFAAVLSGAAGVWNTFGGDTDLV